MREKKPNKEFKENKTVKAPHGIVSYIDSLKADIAAFFDLNSEHSFRPFDVHAHFGVEDRKVRALFNEILHELQESGQIRSNVDGTFTAAPNKPQADPGLSIY